MAFCRFFCAASPAKNKPARNPYRKIAHRLARLTYLEVRTGGDYRRFPSMSKYDFRGPGTGRKFSPDACQITSRSKGGDKWNYQWNLAGKYGYMYVPVYVKVKRSLPDKIMEETLFFYISNRPLRFGHIL